VADDGASLLEVLRDRLGLRTPKDGCSPQGQCGCCTVLVDGQPRVACVTPARRVRAQRSPPSTGSTPTRPRRWADAFCATGASQCGFCTPGIIVRLEGLAAKKPDATDADVERALQAHLCRCTGWRTILDAWHHAGADRARRPGPRRPPLARGPRSRATPPRQVGPQVALGAGGSPTTPRRPTRWSRCPTVTAGGSWPRRSPRPVRAAGKVQGRRTTVEPGAAARAARGRVGAHPAHLVGRAGLPRDRRVVVRTGWRAGHTAGQRRGVRRQGLDSPAPEVARRLADEHGRAVRVVLSREDTVRLGPKRPPVAAGIRPTAPASSGWSGPPASPRPSPRSPPVSWSRRSTCRPADLGAIRGAGWVEAAVLLAALRARRRVVAPDGARPQAEVETTARCGAGACGDPLDEVVLRSYCVGAAHMALGWVTLEGLAVDDDGEVHDLTIRSFGMLRAVDTPADRGRDRPRRAGRRSTGPTRCSPRWRRQLWQHQGLPTGVAHGPDCSQQLIHVHDPGGRHPWPPQSAPTPRSCAPATG
jgi:xanthine dehydrogenase small subunit